MTTEAPLLSNSPKSIAQNLFINKGVVLNDIACQDNLIKKTQSALKKEWTDVDLMESNSEGDIDTEGEQSESGNGNANQLDSSVELDQSSHKEDPKNGDDQEVAQILQKNEISEQSQKVTSESWISLKLYWSIWATIRSTFGSWVYFPGQQSEFTNFKVAFTGVFIKILTTFIIDDYQRDYWGVSTAIKLTNLILDKWMPMFWQWLNGGTGIGEKCNLVALTVILLILYPVDKSIALLVSSTFGAFGVKFSAPWCSTQ